MLILVRGKVVFAHELPSFGLFVRGKLYFAHGLLLFGSVAVR